MFLSILYLLLRALLRLLPHSNQNSNELEVVVLRHQLKILRRQVGRPKLRPTDRLFLTALSRILSRQRWASFMVTPHTLLRWHRQLVKRKWTFKKESKPGKHLYRRSLLRREAAAGLSRNPRSRIASGVFQPQSTSMPAV